MHMNILPDALKSTCNAEKCGKRQAPIHPHPKVIVRSLTVMMKHGHTSETKIIDDHRAGNIIVNPTGRLNRYSGISPRSDAAPRDTSYLHVSLDTLSLPHQEEPWSMKRQEDN